MDYKVFIPVLISFALCVIMGPVIIPILRRLKMGQTEREDGVKSHLKKAGTPTMGGVIILLSIVITSVFYIKDYPKILPILFVTLGFGLIGFLDDYLKVVMRRSDGLYPKQKMALQIVVTAIFAFYILKFTDVSLAMLLPFSGGKYLNIGWLAVPVMFIAVIGTVNGVNFTDGPGWPCFQRNRAGSHILHGGCDRNQERHLANHVRGSRGASWLPAV